MALIAILTNHDDDIYCFRKELIEQLLENGHRVLISCPYGEKFELMKHLEFLYDSPKIDRRGTNVFRDLKLLLHYKRLFRKFRPDIVLTYTAKPNVYAGIAAKRMKIPYISNVTGFGSVLEQRGIVKQIVMRLFRFAFRNASCVMFQNETNMRLALNAGMVKGDHLLIPGSGVNTTRFPLQPYPEGGDGKVGEKIIFNYIGRVLQGKGVDDYIEAAKKIRAEYPNTEFNIIGFIEPTEAHYADDLKKLEENGIVVYRGSQKEVQPWIRRAHCIIHPSIYGEGMSNVLLENAASGRPIITTDNPGCKEVVADGESGWIYPGGNKEKLIETIKMFLMLPNEVREEMGQKGREKMIAEFERKIVVQAYVNRIAAYTERK